MFFAALALTASFLSAQTNPQPASSAFSKGRQTAPEGLGADDWSSIRAAYAAGQYACFEVEPGHRAHNPGQQWTTLFDGRGFTTTPEDGNWSWGLELHSYGWENARPVELAARAAVSADGQRLAYQWDEVLTEWYVNEARGLEHGFTVQARPAEATGALRLELAIRGGLEAACLGDARNLSFVGAAGESVLTYTGLSVVDARGNALEARFELTAVGVCLAVDDLGACYPLTIDPLAQQAYLKASNTNAFDHFGAAVSVWGDTVVVGAPEEDSNATGVNGDASNNSALDAGAAYVFVRSGTSWSQQAYLKASNSEAGDLFGLAVSVSADTLVVGAALESSNATGVDGDQGDNSAFEAGAVYVFVRSGTSWTQQAYLKASNTQSADQFGLAVAVFGDTLVVGASEEDSSATDVNGDADDNTALSAGAAYVFVRSGTAWSQQAYLKASNTGAGDSFGNAVSLWGKTLVVGAQAESSNATGANGDQGNNSKPGAGAAYVFVRSGTSWSQQAYLKASNTDSGDAFGWSVSVSGNTLAVGALNEYGSATGVNGDASNNSSSFAGAAYVFVRSGTSWSQQAYLKASNTGVLDQFGAAVCVSGDTLVVGAIFESSNATGIDGDASNNSVFAAGAAYAFVRSGTSWSQLAYLKASNTGSGDLFGAAVSIFGNTLVVGAYLEDSSATGVGGEQSNNTASAAGAAYVFEVPPPAFTTLPGCFANSATLACSNAALALGTSVTLDLGAGLYPNGLGLYFLGANGADGLGCGLALPGLGELLLSLVPDPSLLGTSPTVAGAGQFVLSVPNSPSLLGQTATFQAANFDLLASGSPLEFSNALEATIAP